MEKYGKVWTIDLGRPFDVETVLLLNPHEALPNHLPNTTVTLLCLNDDSKSKKIAEMSIADATGYDRFELDSNWSLHLLPKENPASPAIASIIPTTVVTSTNMSDTRHNYAPPCNNMVDDDSFAFVESTSNTSLSSINSVLEDWVDLDTDAGRSLASQVNDFASAPLFASQKWSMPSPLKDLEEWTSSEDGGFSIYSSVTGLSAAATDVLVEV